MPRKNLDGAKLDADVARLTAADKASPPTATLPLMEAVRQLSTFIETRAALRWSSAAIAAVLTEAGYPIGAATLRSYRARLRGENGQIRTRDGPQPPMVTAQARPDPNASRAMPPAVRDDHSGNSGPAAEAPSPADQPERATPRAPPAEEHSRQRTYRVNRLGYPSDRA